MRLARAAFVARLGLELVGCGAADPLTTDAVEKAYRGQLLECVDASATVEASNACRAGVNARWQVDAGQKEGGSR